jgi:hypothetical protein
VPDDDRLALASASIRPAMSAVTSASEYARTPGGFSLSL